MTADSLFSLRHAFHARTKPEKWLRDDLHPMDLEDGREFIDDLKCGGSPEKYLLSAIPYPAFLTIDAYLYLLPDLLATIVKDSTQAISVLSHLQESGQPILHVLADEERAAIILFIETLRKTKEEAWINDPRQELEELIKRRPNESTTDNSGADCGR
jgi:hypothetical protein